MFIKYSTDLIPPKKRRGKGSQGKNTIDTPEATVDVSKESNFEPARKQTASRRVIKKKVSIYVDDNIVLEPDVALELGKSMSLIELAQEEAPRLVHATHVRIVIESDPEPARRRPSCIALRDTSSVSKKISPDPSQKLMGSSKGTGVSLRVPDESTIILKASSEGTGTKPGVPDEEKETFAAKVDVILDWGSEQESEYFEEEKDDEEVEWIYTDENEEKKDDADDDKSIDLEKTDDEKTDDELIHGKEQVNDDEDEEMTDAKVVVFNKGDEEITDTAKENAEKTKEVKDDTKKTEFPPSSSSVSVSSGFGNQFLNLSSDKSTVGNLKDSTDAEINSLLDIQIQQEIPQI
ncbi:hypothetical protein Tco_1552715 [Tanacetum coccineum]